MAEPYARNDAGMELCQCGDCQKVATIAARFCLEHVRAARASSDLLAALEQMDKVYVYGDWNTEFKPALRRARTAIRKARGDGT